MEENVNTLKEATQFASVAEKPSESKSKQLKVIHMKMNTITVIIIVMLMTKQQKEFMKDILKTTK